MMRMLIGLLAMALGLGLGMFFPVSVQAGQVTLAWDLNDSAEAVDGYKIHYGTTSGVYTVSVDAGNVDHVTIGGLVGGETYYFAATAYKGVEESGYSNQVSKTVPIVYSVEDGDNAGDWKRMLGAGTATSAYNAAAVSNVLVFGSSGAAALTVFRRSLVGMDSSLTNVTIDIRYAQSLNSYLVFDVSTTFGMRKMFYKPQTGNPAGSGSIITCGVGASIKDGSWHTLALYLQDDLTVAQPGNKVLSINNCYVYVYGSGGSLNLNSMEFSSDD